MKANAEISADSFDQFGPCEPLLKAIADVGRSSSVRRDASLDHLRRETLDLAALKFVVLDEADEMLRMGFIENGEWILEHTPPERQTAPFSATMPREVRRIAERHLRNPAGVEVEHKTLTAPGARAQEPL